MFTSCELASFLIGKTTSRLDAFTQELNYTRGSGWDGETFRAIAHRHDAYVCHRRRGAMPYGHMHNKVKECLRLKTAVWAGRRDQVYER
jgi:hypothetical protein